MLKTFPGLWYLASKDVVAWLWLLLVNLCISLSISSCYNSIPLALGLIDRDGILITQCHSFGFSCHQSVLKASLGPELQGFRDDVV